MTDPGSDQHTADQWHYHMNVIKEALRKWRAGEITVTAKRRAVAEENKRYYGAQCPPHLARTGPRDDLAAVLADTLGVDEDVVAIALAARREGGAQAYADVIATGRRAAAREAP